MSDDTEDDNPDPEDLLQSSKKESRLNSEPADATSDETGSDDPVSLKEAIVDAYAEIDEGDRAQNLTVRDEHLAALIGGLESTEQVDGLTGKALNALDRDDVSGDPAARATALRLLLRVGLSEVDPDLLDTLREANRERLAAQADSI